MTGHNCDHVCNLLPWCTVIPLEVTFKQHCLQLVSHILKFTETYCVKQLLMQGTSLNIFFIITTLNV